MEKEEFPPSCILLTARLLAGLHHSPVLAFTMSVLSGFLSLGVVSLIVTSLLVNGLERNTKQMKDLHLDGRQERRRRQTSCGIDQFKENDLCCQKCPAGSYVKTRCTNSSGTAHCAECQPGTYIAHANGLAECFKCSSCDRSLSQVEKKKCTTSSDTVCGCPPNYTIMNHSVIQTCKRCTVCKNMETFQPCTEIQDTVCKLCPPGYFAINGTCQRCPQYCKIVPHENCTSCNVQSNPLGQIFLILAPLLLGVIFLMCCYLKFKEKLKCLQGRENKVTCVNVTGTDVTPKNHRKPSTLNAPPPQYSTDGHPGPLQQGSLLYAIIDAVPIRRWKEFMRTLPLPDHEIERAEMEAGTSFRDQQYEMLKCWFQKSEAHISNVYKALENMDLPSSAERLQEKVEQHWPGLDSTWCPVV
ncbi:tumor necrosis factor receptor superfamily member 25 isoform X2 [Erpetoichthys calabaricus]|uniref:tumor necrosis factor receptor superfamily member 25 isoform X2 n=1 Tax=Erpetoichthys calabaricus TaxID=27687 RepID=UPI002234A46A|nr:tumor necrosis factor receptor superfamily member 25 isoform X2 [Erpetoichthys calabaricus]